MTLGPNEYVLDMDTIGVYYIATGSEFVKEAELSAQSVRRAMPEIPIAIATDIKPGFDFDHVIKINRPKHGFVDQITNLCRSPFDKTLQFDTDIYVNSDVSELFRLLEQFDIASAHNHNREVYNPPNVPDSFPEYNTGVVLYRNDNKMKAFAETWKKNYNELKIKNNTQNQPSFRKTLFESDLRVATLTPEYNCMIRYPGHVRNEVKISHSRLLDIQTPGSNIILDSKKATQKINGYHGHRLFMPNQSDGATILYARGLPFYREIIIILRQYGLINGIKKGTPHLKKRFLNWLRFNK